MYLSNSTELTRSPSISEPVLPALPPKPTRPFKPVPPPKPQVDASLSNGPLQLPPGPPVEAPSVRTRIDAPIPTTFFHRRIERPAMARIGQFFGWVNDGLTESVHLFELPEDVTNNPPPLWAITHGVKADFVSILEVIWRQTGQHPLAVVKRAPEGISERLFDGALRHFLAQVARPPRNTGLSDPNLSENAKKRLIKRKEKGQARNHRLMEKLSHRYTKGSVAGVFPQGTRQTNGTIGRIYNGAFYLSLCEGPEGEPQCVDTLVVGATIDLLDSHERRSVGDSSKPKYRFFLQGERLEFDATATWESTDDPAYAAARDNHLTRLKEKMLRLNTVTTSQLVGALLMRQAAAGDLEVSREVFEAHFQNLVNTLNGIEGVTIDPDLRDPTFCALRFDNVWKELVRRGYLGEKNALGEWTISLATLNQHSGVDDLPKGAELTPEQNNSLLNYKRDNPLRWCANRFLQYADFFKADPVLYQVQQALDAA